jgi:pSer/pThr/pTyr-binding forkhead associated (FHA) protein
MLKCQECGASYSLGALFCGECGKKLYTDAFDTLVPSREFISTSSRRKKQLHVPRVSAGSIAITIFSSGRNVTLQMNEEIQIGRSDPKRNIYPQLDLTDDDGAAYGVSRLHASLQSTENEVMLVDLGSTNGTFLREERLVPHQPSGLASGDIIYLAQLQVQVFFEI